MASRPAKLTDQPWTLGEQANDDSLKNKSNVKSQVMKATPIAEQPHSTLAAERTRMQRPCVSMGVTLSQIRRSELRSTEERPMALERTESDPWINLPASPQGKASAAEFSAG
jgi:hypothetical protein